MRLSERPGLGHLRRKDRPADRSVQSSSAERAPAAVDPQHRKRVSARRPNGYLGLRYRSQLALNYPLSFILETFSLAQPSFAAP
jgi:hypothetical protein